jgi:DNA-directed RNA polymerase specialized sigma24 family protein
MTSAERSGDHNEAVGHFLKLHGKELELQAIKLTGCYKRIDLHELVSRTSVTVWEKWSTELCALPDDECYSRTLRIMYNDARNLSKSARRREAKCDLLPNEELERLTHAVTCQDPVATEAMLKDEEFAIYKAISQLNGRCKDVMILIVLGRENNEIRRELNMSKTNLTSTKSRACKRLYEILGLRDKGEGGELK